MIIAIPAYKPDEKLLRLLENLRESFSGPILLVDDGGKEACQPIFDAAEKRFGCLVLAHPENRGKGAALKTAFSYIQENFPQTETVVTADADGQHLPKDIFACLKEAEAHPGELILGSRSFQGNVPARSVFGNTLSRWTFRLLIGARVYDTQTGLRAFSADLIPFMLSIPGDRYEYEMQMLCSACREKIGVREITIETVYLEENKSSHFHPLQDARRVYGTLWKNACSKLYQFLSFAFSSGVAWLIDTALFAVFSGIFVNFIASSNLVNTVSILPARIISSLVNYLVNRKVVFRNSDKQYKTLTLYALTVILVFFGNNYFTNLFTNLGIHRILSYILSQIICFPVSFLLQKYIVFPKGKGK